LGPATVGVQHIPLRPIELSGSTVLEALGRSFVVGGRDHRSVDLRPWCDVTKRG
jgi:hypothetical protein